MAGSIFESNVGKGPSVSDQIMQPVSLASVIGGKDFEMPLNNRPPTDAGSFYSSFSPQKNAAAMALMYGEKNMPKASTDEGWNRLEDKFRAVGV